uniref:Uncharacterized protein n=1 Tax=Myotis myotis TaxID=51298 RepID=A0A7J7UCX9_MYOMY|nr:hypothetical protein mMyoMyo1_008746 [Myotis myotis]
MEGLAAQSSHVFTKGVDNYYRYQQGPPALTPQSDRLLPPFSAPNPMAHGAPRPGADFRSFPRVRCSVMSTSVCSTAPLPQFPQRNPTLSHHPCALLRTPGSQGWSLCCLGLSIGHQPMLHKTLHHPLCSPTASPLPQIRSPSFAVIP